MKRINTLLVFLVTICAVNAQNHQSTTSGMAAFGAEIEADGALNVQEMAEKYQVLAVNDTLRTKFMATVTNVCQAKGCWMKLQLQDGTEAMVKFKDYAFFMPTDIAGKEVIVNGKAFVEEMGIEDQKHYAKDAGKSEAEIARITTPLKSFGFEADGVLLKE